MRLSMHTVEVVDGSAPTTAERCKLMHRLVY
jgi:hypothetical protein